MGEKKDSGAMLCRNKSSEMHRHRVVIVRHQYPSLACCCRQDFRVWESAELCLIGGLEVNSRLTPEQGGDNGLIEVRVSLKLDLHG